MHLIIRSFDRRLPFHHSGITCWHNEYLQKKHENDPLAKMVLPDKAPQLRMAHTERSCRKFGENGRVVVGSVFKLGGMDLSSHFWTCHRSTYVNCAKPSLMDVSNFLYIVPIMTGRYSL